MKTGENRMHELADITVERDCLKERKTQKERRILVHYGPNQPNTQM